MKRPVVIEEYNRNWPKQFELLKSVYKAAFGDLAVTIEHVGSTSVPYLAAKPIIDIIIIIDSMELFPTAVKILSNIGYEHEGDLGVSGREAFKLKRGKTIEIAKKTKIPEHHLYVCPKESESLRKMIAFRDILRTDIDLAREYEKLKKKLAITYSNDREAYTNSKIQFIEKTLESRLR